MGAHVRFGVLGPLLAHDGTHQVRLPAARQRILLATLLLRANRVVSFDDLAEAIWDGEPPPGARSTVRSYVMRLRQRLGDELGARVLTRPPGYLIEVTGDELDLHHFLRLRGQGMAAADAGDWDRAADDLAGALAGWRGEPLLDVPSQLLHREDAVPLAEKRLQTVERRIDADLHLGRHQELVAELRALSAAHPLREELHAQLMLALYRSGRQAEALAAFQQARATLVSEIGMDPGAELSELHQQILSADPTLGWRGPAGPAAGPDPAAPNTPRNDLPRDIGDFTGRQDELGQLLAATAAGTPATVVITAIDGMAGVGKTALAVHAAHLLTPSYPDGQLYLDLYGHTAGQEPVESVHALQKLLSAIGVAEERIPEQPGDRAALWRAELAGRSVVLVLDNASSAEQIQPLLPGTAGCQVLITSRRRLHRLDGAFTLSLDVLSPADAVALFTSIAGPAGTADRLDAVADAVRLCGLLPLAIRIAAARLRHRPTWTAEHLVARLREAANRTESGVGEEEVAAAFGLSYQQLGADRQRMFRLLGLHPGVDIDALAAAALADLTAAQAETLLESLLDYHLLEQHLPGRYTFHDLLRDHARHIVRTEDDETVRHAALTRLFDYYRYTAAAAMDLVLPHERHRRPPIAAPAGVAVAFTDQDRAAAWLDAECANLIAIAGHTAGDGWPAYASDLSNILWRYLDGHARYSDALTLHTHALHATRRDNDPAGQASALRLLGDAYLPLGRYDQALDHYREALSLHRDLGDRAGEGIALGDLGGVCELLGLYKQALHHHEQALALYRDTGDLTGQARAHERLGQTHHVLGDAERARDHWSRALELNTRLGAPEAAALEGYLNGV